MRTNSIGRIRKDLDDLCVKHAKLERKLNFIACAVIIYVMVSAANFFL